MSTPTKVVLATVAVAVVLSLLAVAQNVLV